MAKQVKEKRFEQMMGELEQLVETLEKDKLDLEDAIATFERGMELSRECHKRLDQAERKVEILRTRPNGTVKAEPFDADGGEEC